ncbi:hypothetical protein CTI12_AA041570 [Artemisia annua]|uniref:Uncharacterized protein n=1 Tax=Artemisia annua TaxID=35608 RepID=A0A2U1QE58_ARTAN|nr:hypothetical protein CTI12_AA041570 [Artemisia annua]
MDEIKKNQKECGERVTYTMSCLKKEKFTPKGAFFVNCYDYLRGIFDEEACGKTLIAL